MEKHTITEEKSKKAELKHRSYLGHLCLHTICLERCYRFLCSCWAVEIYKTIPCENTKPRVSARKQLCVTDAMGVCGHTRTHDPGWTIDLNLWPLACQERDHNIKHKIITCLFSRGCFGDWLCNQQAQNLVNMVTYLIISFFNEFVARIRNTKCWKM